MISAPVLLIAASLMAQVKPAEAAPAGLRMDIGDEATLFIPEGFRPRDGSVDVLLHLHGAPSVIEPALSDSGWPGVLVEFNRKGLSSVYTKPFADRTLFPRLLDNVLKEFRGRGLSDDPKLGRVAVSSFSAGFGGVRELLKVPEHAGRIDTLVLADSLYSGYEKDDAAARKVDPGLMAGFRDFAIRAASGPKTMIVTHSSQVPGGYASTTETADDLLRAVGVEATASRVDRGGGWVQSRESRKGGFLVRGFEGEGPEDHMRHLRRIAETWTWARAR